MSVSDSLVSRGAVIRLAASISLVKLYKADSQLIEIGVGAADTYQILVVLKTVDTSSWRRVGCRVRHGSGFSAWGRYRRLGPLGRRIDSHKLLLKTVGVGKNADIGNGRLHHIATIKVVGFRGRCTAGAEYQYAAQDGFFNNRVSHNVSLF